VTVDPLGEGLMKLLPEGFRPLLAPAAAPPALLPNPVFPPTPGFPGVPGAEPVVVPGDIVPGVAGDVAPTDGLPPMAPPPAAPPLCARAKVVVSERVAANAIVLSFMINFPSAGDRKTKHVVARAFLGRGINGSTSGQLSIARLQRIATAWRNRNSPACREFYVWVAVISGLAQPHLNPPKAPRVGLCSP